VSRYERNKLEYIVMCVFLYAEQKGVGVAQALSYLLDGLGIRYLVDNYDIEHTLSIEDTLDALDIVCSRNVGAIL